MILKSDIAYTVVFWFSTATEYIRVISSFGIVVEIIVRRGSYLDLKLFFTLKIYEFYLITHSLHSYVL